MSDLVPARIRGKYAVGGLQGFCPGGFDPEILLLIQPVHREDIDGFLLPEQFREKLAVPIGSAFEHENPEFGIQHVDMDRVGII